MIIKKKIVKDVEVPSRRLQLTKMIEDKVEFTDLIFKVKEMKEISFFMLLTHERTMEDPDPDSELEDEDMKEDDNEDKSEDGYEPSELLNNFNMDNVIRNTEEVEKESKPPKPKITTKEPKWIITGTILVEHSGVIYLLKETKKEINDSELINVLSTKECFQTETLRQNDFMIKELDQEQANKMFKMDITKDLFHADQITLTLQEIFENRKQLPITKIEAYEDDDFLVELSRTQLLTYKTEKKDPVSFSDIINLYETENDFQVFEKHFNKTITH